MPLWLNIYNCLSVCMPHAHTYVCLCVYGHEIPVFLFWFVFFPVYQYPFYACEENSLCRNITLVNVKLITNHQVWDSHILLSMLVIDHYDSSFLINIRNKSFVTVLLGCLPRMCWLLTRNTISLKLQKNDKSKHWISETPPAGTLTGIQCKRHFRITA